MISNHEFVTIANDAACRGHQGGNGNVTCRRIRQRDALEEVAKPAQGVNRSNSLGTVVTRLDTGGGMQNGETRVLVLVVAAASGAVTLLAALFPQLEFFYRVPALHVAFETAGALIALLAGLLIAVRFLRRARPGELALACSLGALALSELAFATVPARPGNGSPDLSVWAALGGRALGAVLFALAVFMPGRRLRRPGFDLAMGAGVVAMTPLLIAGAAVAFASRLPDVPVAPTGLSLPAQPDLHADAVLLRSELALTMIYSLAAAGFLRRAEREHDELSGWLAVAAVLAAASHLNYFLYPSSQLVSLSDVFRLCSYAVLLAGSAREISSYWRALPEAAALEERRRIARDLQDGLTWELAYLLRSLDSLDGTVGTETGAHLRAAAERAQLAARLAINRLACTRTEPVNVPVARATAGGRRRRRPRVLHVVGARPRARGGGHAVNYPDGELPRGVNVAVVGLHPDIS
jgi:signal transduction histidine kinase